MKNQKASLEQQRDEYNENRQAIESLSSLISSKNAVKTKMKEAKERMDKAHCMTEQKADDKDGKKKPAHGMVIVIGSKAGPGPSTDGKRDKLDSEKKKE